MPFAVRRVEGRNSKGEKTRWAVVNTDTGRVLGRHKTREAAVKQMGALGAAGAADDKKSAEPLLVVPID